MELSTANVAKVDEVTATRSSTDGIGAGALSLPSSQ